jgi:hypothetical protein
VAGSALLFAASVAGMARVPGPAPERR